MLHKIFSFASITLLPMYTKEFLTTDFFKTILLAALSGFNSVERCKPETRVHALVHISHHVCGFSLA